MCRHVQPGGRWQAAHQPAEEAGGPPHHRGRSLRQARGPGHSPHSLQQPCGLPQVHIDDFFTAQRDFQPLVLLKTELNQRLNQFHELLKFKNVAKYIFWGGFKLPRWSFFCETNLVTSSSLTTRLVAAIT